MSGFTKLALNFIPGVGPFLSSASDLISKHWKAVVIGTMIGLLAYQNFSSTRFLLWMPTIPHLKAEVVQRDAKIKTLQGELDTSIKANEKLTTTIIAQNDVIGEWKTISEGLQKKSDEILGELTSMRKESNTATQKILNGQTPKTCEDSIDYLRNMRSQLTWSTK